MWLPEWQGNLKLSHIQSVSEKEHLSYIHKKGNAEEKDDESCQVLPIYHCH